MDFHRPQSIDRRYVIVILTFSELYTVDEERS